MVAQMDNKQLYANVMAGFTKQHTSLHKWCNEQGYKSQNARKALLGTWKGKKALEFRQILIKESGSEVYTFSPQGVNQSCKPDATVYTSQDIEK